LSKIEAGKLELQSEPFDVTFTVESAVDVVAHRAAEKGLELICSVDLATPRWVCGDAHRLRQVLVNLLGNAIKFTETGEVVAGTRVEAQGDCPECITFFVSDTGIGIPKDRQAAVFESFTQVDGSITRKYGGTGLGLTICNQIVHCMGGTTRLESEVGKGSIFSFTVSLPVGEAPEQPHRTMGQASNSPGLDDRRMLIVDDNATNRRVLQLMLESWGVQPCSASNAEEAYRILREAKSAGRPFDLTLLDVQMPEVDGLEVARTIRSDPTLGTPKILFLSSLGTAREFDPQNESHCDGCLTKPIKQSALMDTLMKLMSNDESPGPDNVTSKEPAQSAVDQAHTSSERRSVLLVEDNAVNRRVATGLLRKLHCAVTETENGERAIEMLQNQVFDLVFMDVQMPVMDGFEATRKIRSDARWGDLPIIAMTAHAMTGDRERCLDAGMSDYVSKPVRIDSISEILHKWCPTPGTSKGDHLSVASVDRVEVPPTVLDVAVALTNLGGDEVLYCEVVEAFAESLPAQMEQLRLAVAERDTTGVRVAAHTLKGSASNVGAVRTSELAMELEQRATRTDGTDLASGVSELEAGVDELRVAIARFLDRRVDADA
jgi:CheY-like chemotaxis protein/HPt (histidine-containing phosphotransfer) domain-containing protein